MHCTSQKASHVPSTSIFGKCLADSIVTIMVRSEGAALIVADDCFRSTCLSSTGPASSPTSVYLYIVCIYYICIRTYKCVHIERERQETREGGEYGEGGRGVTYFLHSNLFNNVSALVDRFLDLEKLVHYLLLFFTTLILLYN